ncbi:hypothetical protein AAG906_011042 [Vitis piasezkii]
MILLSGASCYLRGCSIASSIILPSDDARDVLPSSDQLPLSDDDLPILQFFRTTTHQPLDIITVDSDDSNTMSVVPESTLSMRVEVEVHDDEHFDTDVRATIGELLGEETMPQEMTHTAVDEESTCGNHL